MTCLHITCIILYNPLLLFFASSSLHWSYYVKMSFQRATTEKTHPEQMMYTFSIIRNFVNAITLLFFPRLMLHYSFFFFSLSYFVVEFLNRSFMSSLVDFVSLSFESHTRVCVYVRTFIFFLLFSFLFLLYSTLFFLFP